MKKKSKRTSVVVRAAALTLAGLLSFQNTVYGSVDAGTTAETAAVDAWDGSIAEGFAGGEGTQAAPYQITNGAQLAYLAQEVNNGTEYDGSYFVLTGDIDLGGKQWTRIGYRLEGTTASNPTEEKVFKGSFDGDHHTIHNLTADGDRCVGLFGLSSGEIKNLYLENVQITCYHIAAAVCVYNRGTIDSCGVNSGSVAVEGDNGGNMAGICAYNFGMINRCYNKADITGIACAGIASANKSGGTVKNCYNTGTIKSNGNYGYPSGICCTNQSTIESCLNVGMVSEAGEFNTRKGICGNSSGASAVFNNCYSDKDVCNADPVDPVSKYIATINNVENLSTKELCNGSLPTGFDESIWSAGSVGDIVAADGRSGKITYTYPSLTGIGTPATIDKKEYYNFSIGSTEDWQECTLITTADEFVAITQDSTSWDKNYMLGADIDLSGKEFAPIGDSDTPFTGRFSGNGHTISNAVPDSEKQCTGLFGYNEGTIMDLAVKDSKVTGKSAHTGGICGFNKGTIYGCSYEGTVNGNENTGAICGTNNGGMISNCYAVADVSATGGSYAGGICALNGSGSTIDNCYFAGKVTDADGIAFAITGNAEGTVTNCSYNQDLCTKSSLEGAEVKGLTTYEMTSKNALANMGLSNGIFVKKDNDTENRIAYYPSFSNDTAPAVKYTVGLEFKEAGEGNPYCYSSTAFYYHAFIEFGENVRKWDTNGKFSIKIGDTTVVESDKFVENPVNYNTQGAGEVTLTLCYENDDSEFFPKEITKDLNVTIFKYELAGDQFSFTAPSDLQFDNSQKTATVRPDTLVDDVGEITVKYFKDGVETEPVSAGDYTVKIDVAESNAYQAATDLTDQSWKFTIEKGSPTASYYDFTAPSDLVYDGTDKKAAVTAKDGITGGEITVKYYVDDVEVQDTSLPNTYTVKIDVTESDNCQAVTDLTDPEWKFTVLKAEQEKPECKLSFIYDSDDSCTAKIDPVEGAEYKFDDGEWSDSNTLTGKSHGDTVTAYIRMKATEAYHASEAASDTQTAAHGDMEYNKAKAPTCTEDGNIEYWYCSSCNKMYADADGKTEITDTVLPATGHNWDTAYESDGTHHWHNCKNENCPVTDNTKKDGYDAHIVDAAALWESDSDTNHYHICTVCTGKADVTAHSYDSGVITTEPTETTEGVKTFTCLGCGHKKTEAVPAKGAADTGTDVKTDDKTDNKTDVTTDTAQTFTESIAVNSKVSGNTAKLTWNKIANADSYIIYQLKSGKYVKIKSTTDTSIDLKKLTNGKTYQYMVTYTVNDKESPAEYAKKVTVKIYYKPLVKASATKNKVKLSWKAVPKAKKYVVYKYVNGKKVLYKKTKKRSVTVKGLKSGKKYQYVVRAYVNGKWTEAKKADIVTVKTKK